MYKKTKRGLNYILKRYYKYSKKLLEYIVQGYKIELELETNLRFFLTYKLTKEELKTLKKFILKKTYKRDILDYYSY